MNELLERLILDCGLRRRRDLEADKLIEGKVIVEGLDDGVSILPGLLPYPVFIDEKNPVAFAEASDVEPVSGPSFTVVWAGELAFDEFVIATLIW